MEGPLESRDAIAPTAAARTGDAWDAWDRLVESHPAAGFMQTSWWADFRVHAGYRHFGAVVRSGGEVIGGAIVLSLATDSGVRFYYVPEGPVLPCDDAVAREVFRMVLAAVDDDRRACAEPVSHLRIEPRRTSVPAFLRGFRAVPAFQDPYMEPRDTLCVPLDRSDDELLEQMKPKGRYNVRIARRHGVVVAEDRSASALGDFMDIYRDMAGRQGLAPKPREYFHQLLRELESRGRGGLYFAQHAGRRLAAALVVFFGRRATYFFGASLDARRQVMAPYLLHFEIMRRARALGCHWYDFWGIAPAGADVHPWRGISEFKRKFGGQDVRLVPTLDLVYDPAVYRRFTAGECEPAPNAAPAPPAAAYHDAGHDRFTGAASESCAAGRR